MALRIHRHALLPAVLVALLAASADAASPTVDAAGVALHAGNASNAVALATQALAEPNLTPRDRARVLIDRGLAHEMLGEHDAAMVDLTEAINTRALAAPDQARAFYNRGVALDALGQTEDALGDYSATLRLDPRHAAALNNRGNAYRRLGRLDDASNDYKRSLAAGNPHGEFPNYGLGQIAETQGNPALARSYYQAALAINPQFALAQERLAALVSTQMQALPPTPPAAPERAPPAHAAAPPAPSGEPPVVLRPPGTSPAPSTTAATVTPLEPYVPPVSDSGPIVLRPPPGVRPLPAASDDGSVHLRPPTQLARPRPPKPTPPKPAPNAAAPELKPALGVAGHSETVQLGAWRNEADAADAWNNIVTVAGTMMAGLSPQVVPVDLPGRGRYYRLRAGPVYDGAARLCAALTARKLGCMVVAN